MTTNARQMHIGGRAIARFVVTMLLLLAVLFVSAGTLAWPMAWAYVVVYLGAALGSRALLLRRNPDLIAERAQYTAGEGTQRWDRVIVPLIGIIGPLLTLLVAGLDRRFGWTPPLPVPILLLGLALMVAGTLLSTWAMLINRYFSAVVRIQTDRGQTVVSEGPYRFVRHPGYAGGIVAYLAIPLALGSLWALIPAVLTAALTVLRTALEDRLLHAELPGYAEYARRTRDRLLPGVW